jgi:NitT/TauT family transport system substrate-binding protein
MPRVLANRSRHIGCRWRRRSAIVAGKIKNTRERPPMDGSRTFPIICFVFLAGAGITHAEEVTIKVGMVKSITSVVALLASDKGYFKEFGIKVETEFLDTAANSIALVAQNQFQIVEGGISASYFNAIEKGLPVTIVIDRVTSPIGHNLMLRPDLKDQITSLKQLKGRTIATNGHGAVSTYEVGKLLESEGLTIADVDIKVIPFTQYAVAFKNKAVDAAIVIPPFTAQLQDGGFAVNFKDVDQIVKPYPMSIAVNIINTDWAKSHEQVLKNYYVAYLRAAREFCQAYHHGSNRQDIIDLSVRTGTETRPELLNKYPWPARDPNGKVNVAAMLDMNAWFVKNKMSNVVFTANRLVDNRYVDYAVSKLGPFVLENKDSKLEGCR